MNAFKVNNYSYSLGKHNDKNVIWIHFVKDTQLINHLKEHIPAKWSQSQKCWYVSDNYTYRNWFGIEQKVVSHEVFKRINPINLTEFNKFINALTLKGYSKNTLKTYTIEFAQLLYLLKDKPVDKLTSEKLQSYFLYCHKELKLSENQIHSRINAIKFYFEQVLRQPKMFIDIPRPKKVMHLPRFLNMKQVSKLFEVTENIKHRVMLKLCYGMGLRVGEIVNIKISDIDSKAMKVLIRRGKGKKDRYVNLPESLLPELREYYRIDNPKEYLFEGQFGKQYSIRSVQAVFKNAMKKAKIRKAIGIHGLRHSYATHLLELGTDITLIQKLLGHNNIKTTMLYAHVADTSLDAVKSPLDKL